MEFYLSLSLLLSSLSSHTYAQQAAIPDPAITPGPILRRQLPPDFIGFELIGFSSWESVDCSSGLSFETDVIQVSNGQFDGVNCATDGGFTAWYTDCFQGTEAVGYDNNLNVATSSCYSPNSCVINEWALNTDAAYTPWAYCDTQEPRTFIWDSPSNPVQTLTNVVQQTNINTVQQTNINTVQQTYTITVQQTHTNIVQQTHTKIVEQSSLTGRMSVTVETSATSSTTSSQTQPTTTITTTSTPSNNQQTTVTVVSSGGHRRKGAVVHSRAVFLWSPLYLALILLL